jgi:hypothetical protein
MEIRCRLHFTNSRSTIVSTFKPFHTINHAMKVLLPLLLLASVIAKLPKQSSNVDNRRLKGSPANDKSGSIRKLAKKGKDGESKGDSKGVSTGNSMNNSMDNSTDKSTDNSTTTSSCTILSVAYNDDEVAASAVVENDFSVSYTYPVYDVDTKMKIGDYSLQATLFLNNDCLYASAYSFGYSNETGTYASQIVGQGTCSGETVAIVGGTGAYACAKGFEAFENGNSTGFSISNLYLCSSACSA